MEKVLTNIYYNLKNENAFSGKENVFRAAKKKIPELKKKHVDEWFEKQLTYTLHKPVQHKFLRARTIVKGIDEQWQADLCDLSMLSEYNDNNTFLLTCIDCFSKYAWVRVLKNKSGKEILFAFKQILSDNRKPKYLQTDKGTEFLNKQVQKFLKDQNIKFFTTNSELKASIVERFNRTLKTRMYRYFTAKNTLRYIDAVQDLVKGYNRTYHRSIGMKPIAVTTTDEHRIRKRLYPKTNILKKYKYKVGDLVRISKARRMFKKGYLPGWTEEVFRVHNRKFLSQPVYYLQDFGGDVLKGLFYEKELQRVQTQDLFRIEKVLKRKRRKGKTIYFVKWKGWEDKFNSWVEEIEKL